VIRALHSSAPTGAYSDIHVDLLINISAIAARYCTDGAIPSLCFQYIRLTVLHFKTLMTVICGQRIHFLRAVSDTHSILIYDY
jgi:hypothetical protein